MTFIQKLWNGFRRVVKPTIHMKYDDHILVGVTVHHLDDVFELDNKQLQEAIIFYIEEHLQGK